MLSISKQVVLKLEMKCSCGRSVAANEAAALENRIEDGGCQILHKRGSIPKGATGRPGRERCMRPFAPYLDRCRGREKMGLTV